MNTIYDHTADAGSREDRLVEISLNTARATRKRQRQEWESYGSILGDGRVQSRRILIRYVLVHFTSLSDSEPCFVSTRLIPLACSCLLSLVKRYCIATSGPGSESSSCSLVFPYPCQTPAVSLRLSLRDYRCDTMGSMLSLPPDGRSSSHSPGA